jgi:hypothetical protein
MIAARPGEMVDLRAVAAAATKDVEEESGSGRWVVILQRLHQQRAELRSL